MPRGRGLANLKKLAKAHRAAKQVYAAARSSHVGTFASSAASRRTKNSPINKGVRTLAGLAASRQALERKLRKHGMAVRKARAGSKGRTGRTWVKGHWRHGRST